MFAVVKTGGKQYTVAPNDVIKVEKLNKNVGDKVELELVLVSDERGVVCGKDIKAKCTAEVVSNGKDKKVVVFRYKAKKNVRRKQGHRQPYTELKIVSIK